jgi:ABC-2 type transport system permease protein
VTGIILGGTISNIITISVLFTIGDGVERLIPAVVTICSGMVIPLAFFPDWSQPILNFLPFSGLVDGPYKFYLGIYGINQLPALLLHQLIWTTLLMGLGRGMLLKARRRVIVQGG